MQFVNPDVQSCFFCEMLNCRVEQITQ